jgi:alkylhydroperoxidase family enzyme
MTDNPRIRIVQESEATGETAELYQTLRDTFGLPFVPDIFKLASIRPDLLRVLHDGYRAMFSGGVLPRQVKEMIATTVSSANSCKY